MEWLSFLPGIFGLEMSLIIYKSSAGSGKTYTLAKEYLKLALRAPDYYKNILAVTFTNRAAEEMKERVLEFLIAIANGKHELIPMLSEELKKSEEEIRERAEQSLNHLLHHYGYFNITTIDTFFHRVIRSFSREIGLQGTFGIELDNDKVAEFITADLYQGVEENKQLREWLVEFSMSQLSDGKGYEYRKEIGVLAKQLFSEEFKNLPREQFEDEEAKQKVRLLKDELIKGKKDFEDNLVRIGNSFFDEMQAAGLTLDDLNYKASGPGGFFQKLKRKDYETLLTKRVEAARNDALAWTSKSSAGKDIIIQKAEQSFMPLMNEAINFIESNESNYYTAKAILKHLYTLGLITDLSQRLQEYKKEEEVILISDLPDFLSRIIDDSGSPFIYEKVGSRYNHFLIDEFQDTSKLQWNNFRPLLEESLSQGHENIIVGDAKQSIYGWRGGDPSLLMSGVQQNVPSTLDTSKGTNWRSAPNIIQFNNQLFSALPGIMSELMSDIIEESEMQMIRSAYDSVEQKVADKNKDKEGLVQLEFLEIEKGEKWNLRALERTIEIIESLIKEEHQLNDMALLVRTNWEAAQIVNYVLEYRREHETDIEVISAEGMLLANSSVVQLLLSALRHLLNPEDDSILADLVFRYQQSSKGKRFNDHNDFLKLTDRGLPEGFRKHKEHLLHLPILELTEVLIRTFELDQVHAEFAYLQAFQDAVLEFSKNNRSDIRIFLEWWEDAGAKRSVQLTGALDAIEVITSHKAKGLQYPIVIVPFCTFDFDSKTHPSWYETPKKESFTDIKSIPVDYKAELNKTDFSAYYKKEFAKWHLESLNVLYVAFTRAENGLFALCQPPPKDKKSMYGNASKLLWSFFEQHPIEGWSESAMVFRKGTLPVSHREVKGNLISLNGYSTHKWSNKLTIRKTGKAYYDDEVEQQRNEGIILHQILSEIIHWEDTSRVLDRYEKRMEITREDRDKYERIISNLWNNPIIRSWFEGNQEVRTEVVVLPKDGETRRMDRVLIDGNNVKVVDFKNGQPRKQDERQVQEYIGLLKGMGYEANGHLLYLKTGEVVDV
ncbi:MAG: UvrD-helicase domain-containing protein [Cyclobacteriaceae bacterium]